MDKLIQKFTQHDLRPSPQRVAVMKYLCRHKTHPSAETIYTALAPSYPTLSRTTVYQTLEKLYERGLAQKINIEDGEMRFDADMSNHGHFKCVACGEVFDFFYAQDYGFPKMEGAFEVQEKHLYYKGNCPACVAKRSGPEVGGQKSEACSSSGQPASL
jgi:Fur family peroxide stress response transcriptional regulator